MYARYDRVIRYGAADDKTVYSLYLDNDGLYVFYTGVVGGLVLEAVDGEPRQIVVDEHSMPLIESMLKNEARVQSLPPEELVQEAGHRLILFPSIAAVDQDHAQLVLETNEESFHFVFTLLNDAEVADMASRLRQYVEDSHADH